MSDIDLFVRIGETIYGPNWKAALAQDLGVRRASVQQWANGKYTLRPEIWAMVAEAIRLRREELGELLSLIDDKARAHER